MIGTAKDASTATGCDSWVPCPTCGSDCRAVANGAFLSEWIASRTPTTATARSRAQGHGDFGTSVAAVGKAYDMELSPDHRNRPIGINADGVGSRRCRCPSPTAALSLAARSRSSGTRSRNGKTEGCSIRSAIPRARGAMPHAVSSADSYSMSAQSRAAMHRSTSILHGGAAFRRSRDCASKPRPTAENWAPTWAPRKTAASGVDAAAS